MQAEQQHLLADLQFDVVQASTGKRFANYLIDVIVFYILLFCLGILFAFSPTALEALQFLEQNWLLDQVISLILYGLYMFATEAIFKGKTLGKVITRSRAVNEDGSRISVKTALLRGLTRMVPFNALSALGSPSYPWHDKWTNTYVIDEKASEHAIQY